MAREVGGNEEEEERHCDGDQRKEIRVQAEEGIGQAE